MSVDAYATALLEAVRRDGFDSMPPAKRRRLAEVLRYVADKADAPPPPKSGVLADLRDSRGRY
jgi:hypothetical protein